jgi:hypothetical protein
LFHCRKGSQAKGQERASDNGNSIQIPSFLFFTSNHSFLPFSPMTHGYPLLIYDTRQNNDEGIFTSSVEVVRAQQSKNKAAEMGEVGRLGERGRIELRETSVQSACS